MYFCLFTIVIEWSFFRAMLYIGLVVLFIQFILMPYNHITEHISNLLDIEIFRNLSIFIGKFCCHCRDYYYLKLLKPYIRTYGKLWNVACLVQKLWSFRIISCLSFPYPIYLMEKIKASRISCLSVYLLTSSIYWNDWVLPCYCYSYAVQCNSCESAILYLIVCQ